MGRPPKPLERIKATQRKPGVKADGREFSTALVGRPQTSVPEPPRELHGRAEVEWRNIWSTGHWLNREQDYHWVEMIASAYSDIETFRARVEQDGLVVTGYANQVVAHPLIAEIRKAEALIQKCLQVLGFSPTDRAKLAIREAEARNALEEFLSRSS